MVHIHRFILSVLIVVLSCSTLSSIVQAQEGFDILQFDDTSTGPWSDIDLTSVIAPMVPFKSIELDGTPSTSEYGGFAGVTVTPGENAWLYPFPNDRSWDSADDSSFTFWLAHDDSYLYLGVDVKDDVVNSDNPNSSFWQDDSIEIVTDVWNDNYDNNTDFSNDPYGGHAYVNFEGRFSAWNEEDESVGNQRWSSAVDWTYGEDGDIYGFGEETETGWNMEIRFKKDIFEDPDAGIKLDEGARIGFNIGLNDDDKTGTGPEGNGSRTEDLELQYFWANRERYFGWNELEDDGFFSQSEIETAFEQLGEGNVTAPLTSGWGINPAGRLSHGGAGEIVFGGFLEVEEPDPPVVPVDPVDPVDPIDPVDPVDPPVDPWIRSTLLTRLLIQSIPLTP